ncbi:MAG: MetQ/NlpA family ABC transporter substrate-binding protein [Treponema sp.]|nr:MetQ/NlpA family ABC transporter substrate-binding protein [Treponema sp.]
MKYFFLFFAFSFILFSACQERERIILPVAADYEYPPIIEIKNIRVGVVTGPYGDMFTRGIMPSLEKLGYTAELINYDDFAKPNFALAHNEIDLNIFQHYSYLNTFKFEHDLAISAITEIPTISMGIFSYKYRSIDSLARGITVTIPNDPSNLARSLVVLESAGIITLNPYIEKPKVTLADIIKNPLNIRIVPITAHDLVESLNIYDLSVINGNYALSSGLNYSLALYNEVLAANYMIVVAVKTEDLDKRFARDIIGAVHSPVFRDIITDPEGSFKEFQKPRSFYDIPFENWRNKF